MGRYESSLNFVFDFPIDQVEMCIRDSSKTDQLKAFHELEEGLSMRKGARKTNKTGIHPSLTTSRILQSLARFETSHPGHVLVRRSECPGTVISVGNDVMNEIESQEPPDGFD